MSVEVANDERMLGQFASNAGYADFAATVKTPALRALVEHGVSEDLGKVRAELKALVEGGASADVKSVADALLDLIRDQDLIVVTRGVQNDDVEKAEDAGGIEQLPPHLRNAQAEQRCANCKHYDASTCAMYGGYPVQPEQLCDEYEGLDSWVGVDLDGTLAEHNPEHAFHALTIGPPVPKMVEHVKQLLANGKRVKVFTARVADDPDGSIADAIQAWTREHLGQALEVTNEKTPGMKLLLDDRARQVERNTGVIKAQPKPCPDCGSYQHGGWIAPEHKQVRCAMCGKLYAPGNGPQSVTKAGSGVMVAFWPDVDVQKKIAVENGENPEDLHITLAYLGKQGDEVDEHRLPVLEQALRVFASQHAPVSGTLGGLGRFPATPHSDGQDVAYLGFHAPGIQKFRDELVTTIEQAGLSIHKDFSFTPHMTLKYVAPHAPHLLATPEAVPVTFGSISLNVGAARKDFSLEEQHDFTIAGTITKLDQARQLAFGWFSIVEVDGRSVTDTQGDIITPDVLEFTAYDFVLHARVAGQMHNSDTEGDVVGVGRLVESVALTLEKQQAMESSLRAQGIDATINLNCVAWWGGMKVDDPDTWRKVTTGELRAWSIGGKGKREKIDDAVEKYSPDQPRDDHGRWTAGGGGELPTAASVAARAHEKGSVESSFSFKTRLPESDPARLRAEYVIGLGQEFVDRVAANDAKFAEAVERADKLQRDYERNERAFEKENKVISAYWTMSSAERALPENVAKLDAAAEKQDALMRKASEILVQRSEANQAASTRVAEWLKQGSAAGPYRGGLGYDNNHPEKALVDSAMEDFRRMTGGAPEGGLGNVHIYAIAPSKEQRAYYSQMGNSIHLEQHTSRATIFHEMGHWLESNVPGGNLAALSFLEYRTYGEAERPLNEISKVHGYRPDEVARSDKFNNPYTGKIYRNGSATEVTSMGMQRLAEDAAAFYRYDRSHFNFTVGMFRAARGGTHLDAKSWKVNP